MGRVATCLLLLVCAKSVPLLAENLGPSCRIAPGLESQVQGNAGCLIRIDNRMLLVRHRKTGKLGPPGGTADDGETAQCTAYRETLEETGVEVTVGELLEELRDRFYLFHCTVVNQAIVRIPVAQFPAPSDRTEEIEEVFFVDPHVLSPESWRFPEQLPRVTAAFESLGSRPPE